MRGLPKPDKLGPAIAAAEQPEPVAMRQFQVTIASTGRPAAIALPVDATDGEIAEVCGWVLSAVLNTHRVERARAASPVLEIARVMPSARPG